MKTIFSIFLLIASAAFVLGQQQPAALGMSGKIAKSDTLSITVLREPELSANGQLASNGTLSVPLIGAVKLLGLTTASAETLIESKLRDGYLVRPEVKVLITARLQQTITVNGHVNSPGVFNIPNGQQLTLRQVIGMAGGVTDIANPSKLTIRRGVKGKTYTINLKKIMQNKSEDILLQKDDFIFVPEGIF